MFSEDLQFQLTLKPTFQCTVPTVKPSWGQKRNKQKQGLLPAIVTEQQKCKHQLLETEEKSLFFQFRKLKVRSPVCIYNTFVKSETYRGCAPHM